MKNYLLICFLILAVVLIAAAQHPSQTATSTQGPRYQIVINPNVRADTFLLDTQTGRVWKPITINDIKGDPEVWRPEQKFDSIPDMYKWTNAQEFKIPETK